MGGWKQKEETSLLVPSTFLFLYQPSVCLCVSRVRAYLTTNQQTKETRWSWRFLPFLFVLSLSPLLLSTVLPGLCSRGVPNSTTNQQHVTSVCLSCLIVYLTW
jgi:hypothetical protein